MLLPFTFITYFILRKAYISRKYKDSPKININSKNFFEYFELILAISLGLFFIVNIWGKFLFDDNSNIIWAYIGLILLIESVNNFKKELIFAEDCIIFKGGKQLTKLNKINEFEIKDNKLMIRTSYSAYLIPLNNINKIDANRIISILNQKLTSLFKGIIIFDDELKMIENKT
jgi:hypothetical protein